MEVYELPYGNVIAVGVKRLRCAEVLLQPETDEFPDNEIIIVGAVTIPLCGSVVPAYFPRAFKQ